jgi:serine/threonine-protein kinase
MGTPGYSPPEAIREGRYTPQADVFAWGAVFYELLSGRIPYEGPDTKTTNSYVVAGNAAAPTRHDPSIPAPLSEVTMRALQPSDRERFKDASEAEQALREAWDRCLTQGLVHPAVLAMEETAHDKAPARMHEPRIRQAPPPKAAFNDSAEVTTIDTAPKSFIGAQAPNPFIIESVKGPRAGEDDPTRLMARDDHKPHKPVTVPGVGQAKSPTEKSGAQQPQREERGPDVTTPDEPRFGSNVANRKTSSKAVWFAIAAILAIAAGVAVLYFAGVIK